MNLQLPFPFFGSIMFVTEIPFISQQIAESGEINKFGDLLIFLAKAFCSTVLIFWKVSEPYCDSEKHRT